MAAYLMSDPAPSSPVSRSRSRWYLLHFVRIVLVAAVVLVILAVAIAVFLLMDQAGWLSRRGLPFWNQFAFLAVLTAVVLPIGMALMAGWWVSRVQRHAWRLGCRDCQKEFSWDQFHSSGENVLCGPCQRKRSAANDLPGAHERETEATVSDFDNPYAPPRVTEMRSEFDSRSIDGFIPPTCIHQEEIQSGWGVGLVLAIVMLPLVGGVILIALPVGLVVQFVTWYGVARHSRSQPYWLQAETETIRRQELVTTFVTFSLCLATALAGLLVCYLVPFLMAMQNLRWGLVLLLVGVVFVIRETFVARDFAGRKKQGPHDNLLVERIHLEQYHQYRLVIHWPKESCRARPLRFRFRCANNVGIWLHVYDGLEHAVIHRQHFPCVVLDDWNELAVPTELPEIALRSHERLWFVFDSENQQPWLVPASEVAELVYDEDAD